MVAAGIGGYPGGESHPDIHVLVYDANFDPGDSDRNRITTQGTFDTFSGDQVKVRVFHSASGCGVIVETGGLRFAEDGMQNLVGRPATLIFPRPIELDPDNALLVIWRDGPIHSLSVEAMSHLYVQLSGLRNVFY